MNRAWIPAGALAGVSVAGLIALGPLTDSLNTQVTFQPSIASAPETSPGNAGPSSVPVSITLKGAVGDTSTAALVTKTKGGRIAPATSGDAGQVGYRVHSTSSSTPTSSAHVTTSTTAATPPPATKKKAVKRQTSIIGTIGEQNGDSGLAGGSKGTTSLGEQSSTPSSNAP